MRATSDMRIVMLLFVSKRTSIGKISILIKSAIKPFLI